MNEKNITDLLALLTTMADEIKNLKAWRNEQTQKQAEEEAEREQSNTEFENWLNERRAQEQREQQSAEELKKLMM